MAASATTTTVKMTTAMTVAMMAAKTRLVTQTLPLKTLKVHIG